MTIHRRAPMLRDYLVLRNAGGDWRHLVGRSKRILKDLAHKDVPFPPRPVALLITDISHSVRLLAALEYDS